MIPPGSMLPKNQIDLTLRGLEVTATFHGTHDSYELGDVWCGEWNLTPLLTEDDQENIAEAIKDERDSV